MPQKEIVEQMIQTFGYESIEKLEDELLERNSYLTMQWDGKVTLALIKENDQMVEFKVNVDCDKKSKTELGEWFILADEERAREGEEPTHFQRYFGQAKQFERLKANLWSLDKKESAVFEGGRIISRAVFSRLRKATEPEIKQAQMVNLFNR